MCISLVCVWGAQKQVRLNSSVTRARHSPAHPDFICSSCLLFTFLLEYIQNVTFFCFYKRSGVFYFCVVLFQFIYSDKRKGWDPNVMRDRGIYSDNNELCYLYFMNINYFCHDFFFFSLSGCTSKDNIILNNTDKLKRAIDWLNKSATGI